METVNPCIWNIVSESIHREHGFLNRTQRHISGPFNKRCLGSLFIVQRMKFSHFLHASYVNSYCINFKEDKNLILSSDYKKWINVYDWTHDILKYSFKTKHSDTLYDVKFLNTGGNGMDIISAGLEGQVRHTCISPSGNFISKRIFLNTNQRHRLITVPRSPLEFVAVSSNGGIFYIDLRSERWSPVPNGIASGERSTFLTIEDIAHHPFKPEICICGRDAFVQVFDKRNLKQELKKMCPSTSMSEKSRAVNFCTYNYDGSEILANYFDEGPYLFNNKFNNQGEFLHFYKQSIGPLSNYGIDFFGPQSEYLVRAVNREKIFFQDKNTEAIVESELGNADFNNTISYDRTLLKTHSHLPVVATAHQNGKFTIWAPTSLKSDKADDDFL